MLSDDHSSRVAAVLCTEMQIVDRCQAAIGVDRRGNLWQTAQSLSYITPVRIPLPRQNTAGVNPVSCIAMTSHEERSLL